MRLRKGPVVGVLLAALTAAPASASGSLTVCVVEHEFVAPNAFRPEGPGQYLVRKAVLNHGGTVKFVGAPWQRCLSGSKAGQYDGVIGASTSPALTGFLRLPMKAGQADSAAAIGHTRHVVLRRAGSAVQWDGKRFAGLKGAVYYPSGGAIVREKLAALDVAGNDQAKTAVQLLRMLVRERVPAVVVRFDDVENLLKDSEFASKVELLPEPFVTAYAYFAVRRGYYEGNGALIDKVWADISRTRAAPDWVKTERELSTRVASATR